MRQIAELEGSSLARLSTPSTGPERVAQQQPRYEAAQAAAETYGYAEEGQQGPVASLFDFLMRGQSAVMGAATGLVGAERYGDESTRGGVNEALRRFREGAAGREQYRFSDFTSTGRRIAAGEELGFGQRGWNTALGFIIDTATDPLTYVSFGGSIMGRMRAANTIRGASAGATKGSTVSAAREALEAGIGSANFNTERFIRSAIDGRVTRTDKLAFDLNRRAREMIGGSKDLKRIIGENPFSATASIDDIIMRNNSIISATGRMKPGGIDLLREVAFDIAPDAAAMAYARRSSAGLRRWANDNLGSTIGERYFAALPKDIQGGLRIRLPFARNPDGTPIAYGVQGMGAGRLGDASPFFRKIEDMTQAGRDIAREFLEPVLGRITGKSGAIYYDAVIAATGRKVRTSKGTDGSTWIDYSFSSYADAKHRELRTAFDKRFLEEHETTSQLYRKAQAAYGKKFDDSFVKYMYNTEALVAARAATDNLSDAELAAMNTAYAWRRMLDELGNDALETFTEAGMAFHFLSDYVPRIMNKAALSEKQAAVRKGVSTRPGYIKHREQWAAQWEIGHDGTAYVIRWMPNEDIAKINSAVFETDPTVWMSVYLAELRSSLNDQKILNMLRREGVLTTAQLEKFTDINEAELQRRVIQLTQRDVADGVYPTIARAENIIKKYADVADDPRRAAEFATELESLGITFIRKADINEYLEVDGLFKNLLDGTQIRQMNNGRWRVFDREGMALRHNNRVTDDGVIKLPNTPDNSPFMEFDDFAQATARLDEYQQLFREDMWHNRYIPNEYKQLVDDIADINTNEMFMLDNIQRFTSLSDLEKADYVEFWMKALKRFSMDDYEIVLTKSGRPAYARGMGKTALLSEQTTVAPGFRNWLQDSGYLNIQGLEVDATGEFSMRSQALIKQKIAEQMVNDFAPAKFMQAIQRIFQATQAPQTTGARIYQDFYKPLYAAQKAWMTLGRGPGFVIRNVMGGSWNNWIAAVGRKHTTRSARVVAATRAAQVDARKAIEKAGLGLDPMQVGEIYRDALRKRLRASFSEADTDELLEAWYLFSKNGLAGNRETARLYGELYRGVAGRGSRSVPQQRMEGADFRVRDTGSGRFEVLRDEDMSRVEKFLEMAAGDNWWIRDFMAPKVEISEDYMRFAAFLKGIDEVGLEPDSFVRGYAASQFVKTTQFDYADLADFEQTLKMLVPFYTWTRYNVPLQIRAIIQQPGKVAQALRVHESLGAMFGEEDTLSPSYVADRFGITIPEGNPLFDMLPEWMRPKGDVTLGLTWGEPLSDINQLFRDPFYAAQVGGLGGLARGGFLNYREVAQQFNPIIAATSAAQQALAESGRMDGRNVEEAPRWARALGLAREDPTEPGTFIANRSVLEAIRSTVPLAGQLERVIPFLGSERHEGRWTTSVVSALFGLPVSTIDDWKRASEMDRRSTFVQQQMKAEFGPSWAYRNEMIRRLVAEGATSDFIAALNLREMGDDEVDVLRAVYTWRMIRRLELLIESGTPEDELIAAISAFVPPGSKVESLVQLMWQYVPKPPGDFETGVRQFGLQPITRRDLQELGLTTNDVRNMTEDEQRNLVYWVNRNKGWIGPQS